MDALRLQLSNLKQFLIDFDRFGGRFLARFRVSGRVPGRFVCPNRRPTRSKTLVSRFVSYFLTCEAFRVEGLTLMIRATSSRSTRPNHMSSQGDSLQPPVPVDFRRGPAKVHGVAKLACLEVRF